MSSTTVSLHIKYLKRVQWRCVMLALSRTRLIKLRKCKFVCKSDDSQGGAHNSVTGYKSCIF